MFTARRLHAAFMELNHPYFHRNPKRKKEVPITFSQELRHCGTDSHVDAPLEL